MKKDKKEDPKQEKPKAKAPAPASSPIDSTTSARARVKYLRIAPRKVRTVIGAIRYKPVVAALPLLHNLNKKAARMTEKLLRSAVANAKVLGMDINKLYVAEVRADGGPSMKRLMTRSMGRADRILKRTTHLSVILKEGIKRWEDYGTLGFKKAKVKETEKTAKGQD